MKKIKGSVPIPDNPRYSDNARKAYTTGFNPCIVCGKPCKINDPKTYWIRVGPYGRSYAIPRNTPDQGAAEMGCDPIGPDCLRNNPKLRVLAFRILKK